MLSVTVLFTEGEGATYKTTARMPAMRTIRMTTPTIAPPPPPPPPLEPSVFATVLIVGDPVEGCGVTVGLCVGLDYWVEESLLSARSMTEMMELMMQSAAVSALMLGSVLA